MNEKVRGVNPHKDGGFVVMLGRKYVGYFKLHSDAINARLAAEIEQSGSVHIRREIQVEGEVARIPLHGHRGKFHGWALIDCADLDLVKNICWTKDPRGYVAGRPPGHHNSVTLHRFLIHGLKTGGMVTDHINRDRTDNRRSNLRQCTQAENARNTKISKNNTSGFKGVTKTPDGRWKARIWKDRKDIHIGHYETREEAAAAYDAAARILHLEFASPNTA